MIHTRNFLQSPAFILLDCCTYSISGISTIGATTRQEQPRGEVLAANSDGYSININHNPAKYTPLHRELFYVTVKYLYRVNTALPTDIYKETLLMLDYYE